MDRCEGCGSEVTYYAGEDEAHYVRACDTPLGCGALDVLADTY
jgi:hypothetical protein